MFKAFNDLVRENPVFWFCAIAGSGLFVIQFLFTLLGHSADDTSGEMDLGKFKWLSKQALSGFLMMFGWVGLTSRQEFLFSLPVAALLAFAGGTLALFATGFLFRSARRLHSPGNVFRLEDAIGKEAIVYQRIPKEGVGKISLSLHQLTYEIDAISQLEEIPSFTQVQILKKADEKTVVVVPIK